MTKARSRKVRRQIAKHGLLRCPLCKEPAILGRDAEGWVVFCSNGKDHFVEVTGATRHRTIMRWKDFPSPLQTGDNS